MINKTLIIEIKTVYGNEAIYPANDTAQVFADLIGTKTLGRMKLALIQGLGYTVEIKAPALWIIYLSNKAQRPGAANPPRPVNKLKETKQWTTHKKTLVS